MKKKSKKSESFIDRDFIMSMVNAQMMVIEIQHRMIEQQRQLDAAEVMIRTLTKRLAEMEFKTDKEGGDL